MTASLSAASLSATVLTLFPAMFPGPLGQSLVGKALADGLIGLDVRDIRAHATDRHRTVDDAPFGGGAGMVMRPDVLDAALEAAAPLGRLLVLSPRGRRLDQALVRELAQTPRLTLVCGRYEGFDQRVLDANRAEELSIGDYVLAGGELAAMVVLEAVARLIPGVLGNEATPEEESFESDLLEYPHFTRPAVWTGRDGTPRAVPETLLSGHHGRIAAWRRSEAEALTRERRPDLWARYQAARPA